MTFKPSQVQVASWVFILRFGSWSQASAGPPLYLAAQPIKSAREEEESVMADGQGEDEWRQK